MQFVKSKSALRVLRFKDSSSYMEKYKYKLSLIIPAYNVEAFIECCLSSIQNQDIAPTDCEVIIINDGSTDSTLQKIQNFIDTNLPVNWQVITIENQGLSAARNLGLNLAKGEYIWFIDSDDWIVPNSLSRILQILQNFTPDILALNTIIHQDDVVEPVIRNIEGGEIYSGSEVFYRSWKYPYSGAQFYIYNHLFLDCQAITFEKGIYFEDLLFTPQVLDNCERVGVLEEPVYNYRLRINSITTTNVNLKKAEDLIFIMNHFLSKLNKKEYHDKGIYKKMVLSIMTILVRNYMNHLPSEQSDLVRVRIAKNKDLRQLVVCDLRNLKYKLVYLLPTIFPFLCGK